MKRVCAHCSLVVEREREREGERESESCIHAQAESAGMLNFHLDTSKPGNTKGGSITVPLTSCFTGLETTV